MQDGVAAHFQKTLQARQAVDQKVPPLRPHRWTELYESVTGQLVQKSADGVDHPVAVLLRLGPLSASPAHGQEDRDQHVEIEVRENPPRQVGGGHRLLAVHAFGHEVPGQKDAQEGRPAAEAFGLDHPRIGFEVEEALPAQVAAAQPVSQEGKEILPVRLVAVQKAELWPHEGIDMLAALQAVDDAPGQGRGGEQNIAVALVGYVVLNWGVRHGACPG